MPKLLHYIINRGVTKEQGLETRRRVSMINIGTSLAIVASLIFVVINTINGKWILLLSNTILMSIMLVFFLINAIKYNLTYIFIMLMLLSVFFLINSILFHNNLQYALLTQMVVTILLLNDKKLRVIMLCIHISFFVTYIYFQDSPGLIPRQPVYRNCIIVFVMLSIFACMLEYFKIIQLQYQQKLTEANKELIESNRVKERMLSILSHDFNAPVANLISTLFLVDAEMLSPEQFRDVSAKLKLQLQVLTTSLQDVLHWSKMQIQGDTGRAENINVKGLIAEILPLFEYTLGAKKLELKNNIPENVLAYANKDHLKLIFRNLLHNAIKFSFAGGTILIETKASNSSVRVSFHDEGVGIQPAVLTALQNENLTFRSIAGTANEKGTGLGLMLVREFLQKNNGMLTIQSELGQGSTFTVILPAVS